MQSLTPHERETLDAFRELVAETGASPSIREVTERMGRASPAKTWERLGILVKKGYLIRDARCQRAFRLAGPPEPLLDALTDAIYALTHDPRRAGITLKRGAIREAIETAWAKTL